MPEKRWSFEGGTPVLREMPRTRSSIDLIEPEAVRPPDDTVRLDDGGYRSSFAPPASPVRRSSRGEMQADAEFGVRDAFAATALASLQSTDDSGSVLDVNGAELTRQVAILTQPVVTEETWTPPTLTTPPPASLLPSDPAIPDLPTSAEPLPEIGRRQRAEPRRNSGRVVMSIALVGVLLLLAGGLYFTLTEREAGVPVAADSGTASAEGGTAASAEGETAPDTDAVAPAAASGEQLASVEGVLELTDASLREVAAEQSSDPATSFAPGQKVSLWLTFDYTSREGTDNLGVIWFKEDRELTRSSFGLTSEVQMTAMAAPALEEPGSYRADIALNDQVIHSVSFEVTG